MKKNLKCILSIACVFLFALALTGCGDKENTGGGSNNSSLENIKESNYKEITKDIFGLDIKDNEGWTLEKVESPNKVNNLNISWEITNSDAAKSIIEYYYNQTKSASKDGVYSQGYNEDYTALERKEKYDDFNSFYDNVVIDRGDFFQGQWIYDNNGKDVSFSISIEPKLDQASLSFVLIK